MTNAADRYRRAHHCSFQTPRRVELRLRAGIIGGVHQGDNPRRERGWGRTSGGVDQACARDLTGARRAQRMSRYAAFQLRSFRCASRAMGALSLRKSRAGGAGGCGGLSVLMQCPAASFRLDEGARGLVAA